MMNTCKILDGYALNNTDGYTVYSDWQDVHSSPFVSISAVFSVSAPNGTLSYQCSNDQSSDEVSRGTYGSSQFVPFTSAGYKNYPVSAGSPQGTPLDANTLSTFTVAVTTLSTNTMASSNVSYRWIRLVWTPIADTNTTIDAWMHRKAQIGRVN